MKINKGDGTMHMTAVGGNIYSDLDFSPEEAAALKERSQKIISEKLAIKESLMAEIDAWIINTQITQADAAKVLCVTRPRVSDVVHRKTAKFTIDALVDMLARVGKHVSLSVR